MYGNHVNISYRCQITNEFQPPPPTDCSVYTSSYILLF